MLALIFKMHNKAKHFLALGVATSEYLNIKPSHLRNKMLHVSMKAQSNRHYQCMHKLKPHFNTAD